MKLKRFESINFDDIDDEEEKYSENYYKILFDDNKRVKVLSEDWVDFSDCMNIHNVKWVNGADIEPDCFEDIKREVLDENPEDNGNFSFVYIEEYYLSNGRITYKFIDKYDDELEHVLFKK